MDPNPEPDPDQLVRGIDPRIRIWIRIRTKMSRIPNTCTQHFGAVIITVLPDFLVIPAFRHSDWASKINFWDRLG